MSKKNKLSEDARDRLQELIDDDDATYTQLIGVAIHATSVGGSDGERAVAAMFVQVTYLGAMGLLGGGGAEGYTKPDAGDVFGPGEAQEADEGSRGETTADPKDYFNFETRDRDF